MTASKPDPQSRFTVTAGVSFGRPARRPMWRGRGVGGLKHVAEDHAHGAGSTPERSGAARPARTQIGGGEVFEDAAEGAEAGADAERRTTPVSRGKA
jgi:hypothetical protein